MQFCVQANQIGKVEKLPLWQYLRKKDSRDCVFWKYLTTLATSTTDTKRTTSLANLPQLCLEKQLHWNVPTNCHQPRRSSFTNQK